MTTMKSCLLNTVTSSKDLVAYIIIIDDALPFALHLHYKRAWANMERLGVITRTDEPTGWVNSLVVVKKNGDICVCMDLRDLNRAIKREHYKMSTRRSHITVCWCNLLLQAQCITGILEDSTRWEKQLLVYIQHAIRQVQVVETIVWHILSTRDLPWNCTPDLRVNWQC